MAPPRDDSDASRQATQLTEMQQSQADTMGSGSRKSPSTKDEAIRQQDTAVIDTAIAGLRDLPVLQTVPSTEQLHAQPSGDVTMQPMPAVPSAASLQNMQSDPLRSLRRELQLWCEAFLTDTSSHHPKNYEQALRALSRLNQVYEERIKELEIMGTLAVDTFGNTHLARFVMPAVPSAATLRKLDTDQLHILKSEFVAWVNEWDTTAATSKLLIEQQEPKIIEAYNRLETELECRVEVSKAPNSAQADGAGKSPLLHFTLLDLRCRLGDLASQNALLYAADNIGAERTVALRESIKSSLRDSLAQATFVEIHPAPNDSTRPQGFQSLLRRIYEWYLAHKRVHPSLTRFLKSLAYGGLVRITYWAFQFFTGQRRSGNPSAHPTVSWSVIAIPTALSAVLLSIDFLAERYRRLQTLHVLQERFLQISAVAKAQHNIFCDMIDDHTESRRLHMQTIDRLHIVEAREAAVKKSYAVSVQKITEELNINLEAFKLDQLRKTGRSMLLDESTEDRLTALSMEKLEPERKMLNLEQNSKGSPSERHEIRPSHEGQRLKDALQALAKLQTPLATNESHFRSATELFGEMDASRKEENAISAQLRKEALVAEQKAKEGALVEATLKASLMEKGAIIEVQQRQISLLTQSLEAAVEGPLNDGNRDRLIKVKNELVEANKILESRARPIISPAISTQAGLDSKADSTTTTTASTSTSSTAQPAPIPQTRSAPVKVLSISDLGSDGKDVRTLQLRPKSEEASRALSTASSDMGIAVVPASAKSQATSISRDSTTTQPSQQSDPSAPDPAPTSESSDPMLHAYSHLTPPLYRHSREPASKIPKKDKR